MPAPLRVLILNQRDPAHPQAGGAEVHVAEIFRRLAARDFEVVQAACGFAGAPQHARVEGLHVRRMGRLPAYYPRAAAYCARETRRGRFDVVVECLNKLPFYAPLYSAAPVLALCHHLFGDAAFLQAPWPVATGLWLAEKPIPRLYRGVPFVAISESSRADLVARGVPAERIRVIHCGIRRPKRDPLPWASRPLRVTYVGRLEPYKQIDVLLRALAQVARRFPDVELWIVGRGKDRERLERVARDVGVAGRTHFTGFVEEAVRDQILSETRVCVYPSSKEGWGLTVIEANALGVPVVATDAPGLRDSVRDGSTGLLAPDGDAPAFASRIESLLGDDLRAETLAAAALAWSQHFDWDRAADEMAEALQEVRRRR